MPNRILLASNNPHKLSEFRRILAPRGFEVVSPAEIGLDLDVDETGESFAENALVKAHTFATRSRLPTIADDSGLVVETLGGVPGIYSHRFVGPEATDRDRNESVLERLKGLPAERRRGEFVAAIAIVEPGQEPMVFEGRVKGVIATEPKGANGFGYDSIFYYPPLSRTFGELSAEEKSRVSHRARALAQAVDYLTAEATRRGI